METPKEFNKCEKHKITSVGTCPSCSAEKTNSQVKKDGEVAARMPHLEPRSIQEEDKNKKQCKTKNAENHPDVIILDDNVLSLSCYAEEYPDNWEAIAGSINTENKDAIK